MDGLCRPVVLILAASRTTNVSKIEENLMKVMLTFKFPLHPFNELVKAGTAGQKMQAVLEATKPEATYFTEVDGLRSAIVVVELSDASRIPALVEPWFLTFDAQVSVKVVMTAEDMQKAGLDEVGKKWK